MQPRILRRAMTIQFGLLVVAMTLASQGCLIQRQGRAVGAGPFSRRGGTPEGPPLERSARPTVESQMSPNMETANAEPPTTPSATTAVVTVTAVDGNLFIRRGPHMAFNQIGVLYKGESAAAVGRDVLARWVQIAMPSQSGIMGWLSVQTRFSSVHGEVKALPVIDTLDWPDAGTLRNCTYHEMLVQPGDVVIPSLSEFPDNEMWIYPGEYKVYDLEVAGEPDVLSVTMREGIDIDIREDGNGERRKCPVDD